MLGILDLTSLGYLKIKQGILQRNFSKYYRYELADVLCEQFNKFINEETKEKYPWLDPSDKRKYISDRAILEKIHRPRKFLFNREKREVTDMLYKHQETFSLRDVTGTCPNIEVEIDVTDKSPFLFDHIM